MPRTRILVADDDPDVRDFYRMVLAEHYDLLMARDGLEAWKFFEEERPRLVLTDLNMPGLNGLDLTSRIRAHATQGATPVIIVTGTTRNSDLPPGFWRLGTSANAFLEKPATPEQILHEIRRQLVLAAQVTPLPPGRGTY